MKATREHKAICDGMLAYQKNPRGFMVNVLSLNPDYIWDGMQKILDGVRDHQKVAIRAGHSVSKTFTMGRVVPWFKTCFVPSTVITTAPSDNLVKNQLWREIHAAYSSSKIPLGGKMHGLSWDLKPRQEILDGLDPESREKWEKNFAVGFSTSPDTATEHATKMHGWHNEWILVVVDEACGILPQIWRTIMESLIIDEQCRIVAIGNPTDPESDFAKVCYSSDLEKNEGDESYISDEGWYVITIDSRKTPNYIQRKRIIPGLAGYEWAQDIIKKYGPDGDGTRYRIKGLFPTFKEGTFYGFKLATCRKEKRVGNFPPDETARVWSFSDYGKIFTATIFVQFTRGMIRIVDCYYDNEGLGAPNWATVLKAKGYHYAGHYAGPDLTKSNARSFQTGNVTRNVLAGLGFDVKPCRKHLVDDGIEAVKDLWNLIEINEPLCDTFIKAAAGYGLEKNQRLSTEEHTVYHDDPAKTWHRHMMDALRHMAIAYREGQVVIDNVCIGRPEAILPRGYKGSRGGAYRNWNVLNGLRK